jgi:parallel beta-helix repeat protein
MLEMKPYSKIILGQNSKLLFQNGARLIANNATFTSLDSTSTWDGIYLEDNSNDTIKNCIIENASNGINITDKTSMTLDQPSTEISGCTFRNSTIGQLTNAVYINNSYNVLIKDNTFESTQLANGFQNGIMTEYCPSGVLNIIDNEINNSLTGITIIQSSPYIARNIITGQTGTGKGIYLDNSNGTIEYNIVNNYVNSFTGLYSSPYLLKNIFSNASEKNFDIYTASVPLMHPVLSSNTLRWIAGNNFITGYPSTSGMYFNEEAYPDMDEGYNDLNTNGSDYMSGVMPSGLSILYATKNWWDEEPQSGKFNVSGGTVIYDPTYQGAPPAADY